MSVNETIAEGTIVGGYEVLTVLGSGGAGIVYLARQRTPNRLVALKALQGARRDDPDAVKRFQREREVAWLTHPNVITVYESFVHESVPFISMELAHGGSLRRYVGELSLAQIFGVLDAILVGLEHLARSGIVHRDIKPENVMVSAAGEVKITDFGIARVLYDATITESGNAPGTPRYMAPEQSAGADVGPWTDLYSVGMVAYELLATRLPAPGERTPRALERLAVSRVRRGGRGRRHRAAMRLADWLGRMIDPDLRLRYASARAARTELDALASEVLPDDARRPAPLAGIVRLLDAVGAEMDDPSPRTATDASEHDGLPWARRRVLGAGGLALRAALRQAPVMLAASALAVAGYVGSQRVVAAGGGPSTASTSMLRLRLPDGWAKRPPDALSAELGLTESIRLAPEADRPGLVAGITDARDPSLLPVGVEAHHAAEVVKLGATDVLRYRDALLRRSGRRLTLYAVSTDAGVATIACPAGPRAFAMRCEGVAATLELRHGSAYEPGPDDAYARPLRAALGVVDHARRTAGRALARSATGAAQARAADELARGHEAARLIVRQLDPRPADRAIDNALVDALGRCAQSYRRLAGAARDDSARAYRAAARAVRRAQAALDRAATGLRAGGYAIIGWQRASAAGERHAAGSTAG